MGRLAAIALIVSCFALPACAQHGASHGGGGFSHGGFSGHAGFSGGRAGSAFHGGFSSHPGATFHGGSSARPGSGFGGGYRPGQSRIAPPFRYGYNRAPGMASRISPRGNGFRQPYTDAMRHRAPYNGRDRDRGRDRFHRREYGWGGTPYWGGWVSPYLPGYFDYPWYDFGDDSDNSGYDDSQGYADNNAGEYGVSPYNQDEAGAPYGDPQYPQQQPYAPQPYPQPQYAPQAYAPPSNPAPSASAASSEGPVTVVFKDGRQPEKIHNYLLTSTMLSVLDQHRQEIPLDQIDLTATTKVNRDAGVDFVLPPSSR